MATARYWRLVILANASFGQKTVAELAFLDTGGTDLSTGGTPFASSSFPGAFGPDKAFDRNNTTFWASANNTSTTPEHLGYDHGVDVTPVKIRVRWANAGVSPLPPGAEALRVQYSTDNVVWSTSFFLTLTSGAIAVDSESEFAILSIDSLTTTSGNGFCFASSATPTTLAAEYLPDSKHAFRDFEFGGFGRIAGTVKEDGSPDVPVKRRVRLHREQDGLLAREVWSHPTTGAYSFDYIDATKRYTVITYDYEHDYRAVIADNITPEAMP